MQHSPAFLALVNAAKADIREIEIQSLNTLSTPYVLVDTREDHEWQAGHLPGAMHLGKGIIERDIEHTVQDKQQPIILYCGGGFRSALAAQSLQQMGYQQVYSLAGGFKAWCEAGLPLDKP